MVQNSLQIREAIIDGSEVADVMLMEIYTYKLIESGVTYEQLNIGAE